MTLNMTLKGILKMKFPFFYIDIDGPLTWLISIMHFNC